MSRFIKTGFSLPMRDGNSVSRPSLNMSIMCFSLPMRDGNFRLARLVGGRAISFSLPMRDGNTGCLSRITPMISVLAYL